MNNNLSWDDQIYLLGFYLRHNFMIKYDKNNETAFINKVYEICEDEFGTQDPKFMQDLLSHMKECYK